ncbi:hypothetical protein GCM10023329_57920 [Streptomyces sanyensis]|uniref:Uncharacterized protein n=1 Tax=Streptomyces sanyensis TaxID=568869 RepID=A0ABP9BNC7_9ACTN
MIKVSSAPEAGRLPRITPFRGHIHRFGRAHAPRRRRAPLARSTQPPPPPRFRGTLGLNMFKRRSRVVTASF